MPTFKKILCPTDFSEASYVALPTAADLARQCGAQLLLVHVVPFPAPNDHGLTTEEECERVATLEAESKLRQISDDRLMGCGGAHSLVRIGDPAIEIVRVAEQERADMIVIATHGYSGWRHFVFGSVAESVLRLAPCPVLTVRPPENGPSGAADSDELGCNANRMNGTVSGPY